MSIKINNHQPNMHLNLIHETCFFGAVFNYPQAAHNVYRVNGTAFQQCMVPSAFEALISGNDIITLATPGKKWYICGVGNHCDAGMRLAITVSYPVDAPAPAPAAGTSAANEISPLRSCACMLAALASLKMIMASW